LEFASAWTTRADCSELTAPALLLGLLAEPECRAATMLARCQIDTAAVCVRWPEVVCGGPTCGETPRPLPLSADVQVSLQLACGRLADFPQPLELATEHLLLGLAAADHEVSVWLRQRGLDPQALEAEIHKLYGYSRAGDGERGTADMFSPGVLAGESPHGTFSPGTCAGCGDIAVSQETPIFRILDAAANRAREALRVVEDYVRFVLDDRHLTGLCKQMRHDLTAALARLPQRRCLGARETQADVGTTLTAAAEQRREDASVVLAANLARLQESLRSLEEFGKVVDADLAAAIKQLRYRAYTLQRAVEITRHSIERLAGARLYVLIDGRPTVEEFHRLASALIEAGVHVVQLRDKRLGDRGLLERARLLRELTAGSGALFVMNDRPDLAVLARADGVHVGQDELSVKDARTIVGPATLVGVSAHSIEQARQVVLDGANYLGVGPTFPSGTKSFEQFPGLELLRAVAAEIRLPAFAIGGVCRVNLDEVLAAGFTRIAVSEAVASAEDPAAAVDELLAALGLAQK
jgi:thiamine-phosphate pyrophosphorylase